MRTAADFDIELIETVMSQTDIAVLLDTQLNYVAVNEAACNHLRLSSEQLVGRCILDLFPDMIASASHRNLLRALDGETIINFKFTGRYGTQLQADYVPVYPDDMVIGILISARKTGRIA